VTLRRPVIIALEIAGPLAVLVAWQLLASENSFYFPAPTRILTAFQETWLFAHFGSDLMPSMVRLFAGYVIAVFIGVLLGMAVGSWLALKQATDPIFDFLRGLPPPTLVPFSMVVFGVGTGAKIFVIVAGSIWPILLATIDGVRSVDPLLVDTAKAYHVPRRTRWLRVTLPAASPQIVAGMRVSLSLALILMVVSELVASSNGIGYLVLESQRNFDIPVMWAGILLLGLLGYVFNAVFVGIEERALKWHRASRALKEG
jgi:ABC-type nitrate/sulfonate/bicarbonate transport system permease component